MARLPLDKSWIKCLTLLEIRGGFDGKIRRFLNNFPEDEMSDDVKACRDLLNAWNNKNYYLPVRNFRSLAVGLEAIMRTKKEIKYEMLMGSQLKKRKLHDENSSQGISAMILCGKLENVIKEFRIVNPYKLNHHNRVAFEALVSYETEKDFKTYDISKSIYKEDKTLMKQFDFFINKLQGNDIELKIDSAEDVPLAVAFGLMDLKTAEEKYPQLRNHETDRIEEMKNNFDSGVCISIDHRIVMARSMIDVINGKLPDRLIAYPKSTNKSFPKFWNYIKEVINTYGN